MAPANSTDPTLDEQNTNTTDTDGSGGLDTILPEPGTVTVDGVRCQINRLRMRELMKLVRVLTTGVGDGLSRLDYSAGDDAFAQQLLGLAIVGIPEAEDEFAELLQAVVVPVDPRYSEQVREAMDNPEADLLVDIIQLVVAQEQESFGALLGKLRNLIGTTATLRNQQ